MNRLKDRVAFRYLMADVSSQEFLRQAERKFQEFNIRFFDGLLRSDIRLMRNAGPKLQTWAHYRASSNVLSLSPRLSLVREEVFDETLLHEMCHAAVDQIDNNKDEHHGPLWAAWMRKVGLRPNTHLSIPEREYTTEAERVEEELRREDLKRAERIPLNRLEKGMPVKILHDSKWILGRYLLTRGSKVLVLGSKKSSAFRAGTVYGPLDADLIYQPTPQEERVILQKINDAGIDQTIDDLDVLDRLRKHLR